MRSFHCDALVIGGGPTGMAAAISAKMNGAGRVTLLEQQDFPGGMLPQCVHDGFGLHIFQKNLSGPEYALYYKNRLAEWNVEQYCGTTVFSVGADKTVTCAGGELGFARISAKAVIIATGCKEKTRGALRIPGSRPAGVYTAGAAQYMVNIQNYLPGRSVVILGLGDIGLIMARRLTLEGARVKLVLGLEAAGLQRNMVQCVYDFNIPLKVGYTVSRIHGAKRLKGVTITRADAPGAEAYVPCDTLLLSAGLTPDAAVLSETEIRKSVEGGIVIDACGRTSIEGIFACGNVVKTHDLVDHVTAAGEIAGFYAAAYIKGAGGGTDFPRRAGNFMPEPKGLPNLPTDTENTKYRLCTVCPSCCTLKCVLENGSWSVSGNTCPKGTDYGLQDVVNPLRVVTTTVKYANGKRRLLPVKTDASIPMAKIRDIMRLCRRITVSGPVKTGSIILRDAAGTEANIVACDDSR